MKIRFSHIKWDTEQEGFNGPTGYAAPELPAETILTVGDEVDLDTEGADVLSDEYGFCVFGFDWEMVE
jgi:hypothetical protein